MLAWFIYFVVVVSFIDTMAQLPILSPFAYSLGASSIMVGLIMGAYSFFNMAGNLGAGFIIDRYGRKKAITFGMLLAGMAVFLYGWVNFPYQLLGLRIFHGLGGAILVPAAFAYLGDRAKTGSTGRAMGYSGAAVGLAALLGPMLGGIGKDVYGYSAVFISLGLLLMITSVLAWFLLPETYQIDKKGREVFTRKILLSLIKNHQLQIAYLSSFGLMFAMGLLAYAFPITLEALGFTSKHTGILFSIFSIVAIIVFILPISGWSDRVGRYLPISIGMILITIAFSMLPLGRTLEQFAFMMVLYGFGYGLIFPAMNSLVVDQTEEYFRGTAFGIFYAVFSLGGVLGPIAGGMANQAGYQPFWIGSLVLIIVQIVLSGINIKGKSGVE
ncbi:Predicted arabinose efflux permease, MFS family [Thermosyntropha lipolytica DSM 11003]|uniref:Predicted arabinose efflux permease, MFS family n=1 Tax=Thermosyntropha lipolytica DSM 11003 TaxID=1123382 RepID=A0A1M5K6N4_9FIRM|nr:MFS transporter [Thermosyntropha lipolytica]SHG47903.1 Predicted arabinose efflux permease, MFS family [Thermosyntropha lipolytica DSM 11003]